uniref:Neural cell adhesion molecule L1.1-like n=1 Tax=Seriola lalandi dorsalis TaxID=1841481 RepID=A0A3B4X7A8_SERLL
MNHLVLLQTLYLAQVFHYCVCVCVCSVSQPPVLTEMPTSYTAFSQEDINLPCEATGNPTPIFRWIKDGKEFGFERKGSGTLQAEDDEPLDTYEGFYRCYASNNLGTAMTQTVHVIVEPQPVLQKQQKVRKRAYEGESIVLSCNPPESSTPPHIHWMDKRMVHIKQSDRVMVGLDGNLYFSNLLRSDSRDDYICNAQYSAARTILPETAVTLTVIPSNDVANGRKPHLFLPIGTHSTVNTLRGRSITLECIPKGLPTPKVEWKKKDGSLDETSGLVENNGRWLHFNSISQSDDGEYECRASNLHGSITHSFTVTVEAAPYWVKEPQNLLYAPGETVRLDCQAEGIPTPNITWSINGQLLSGTTSFSCFLYLLFNFCVFLFCFFSSSNYELLKLPPQILSSDRVVYKVTEGGDIKLHCETFGSPRPHVTWEGEDMVPLLSDPRVSLLTNGTIELSSVSHEDSGTYTCSIKHTNISISAHLEVFSESHTDFLVPRPQNLWYWRAPRTCALSGEPALLTNVQTEDTAAYSCEVITDLDNVKASGSITVVARPDPPKDLSLSDIADHSLTLSWIPGQSHNSPIAVFIVEAQEQQHTEEGKWRWEEWKQVPGDFNHLQLNLHPYCTYRFRVIAVNEIGPSSPSKPSQHHRSPPAVPDFNPTGVRSDSTDPKTLVITWNEMEKHLHNGQDFQYKVSWREAGETGAHWNYSYIKSPPFLVNNTGTYTPFEIKVQAVNSLGEGPSPEPEIGHSGEDKPEDAPTGIETTVWNSTVRVRWNEAQNIRGLLLGYKVRVTTTQPLIHYSPEPEKETEFVCSLLNDVRNILMFSSVVGPLQLFSRYELTVTAFNSKGEGPHSAPHRFSTPEGAPGPPASLRFESPTEKSVVLYWTPPVEANGILLGYMVQYEEGKVLHWSMQMEVSDPSVTHIVLDSLESSSHYIFKVIARTASGYGLPITQRGATLLDGAPPSNITIVQGNTLLNLSWVPGERIRNHGFHICYLRKTGAEWQQSEVVNSTQGFYSLTGLQPGTEYHLKIKHGNDTQWENVTWTVGPVPSEMPGGFATQGWLIGLISAIVLLVLILLILCLIKRSRGGKYAVKDKEDKEVDSEARPMKDETFGEYSDGDEKRSDSHPSICGESKLGSDDSLAEYGDSVDIQFNEDGSFIGQYSGRGPVPHGNESSALVSNAVCLSI